jgi:hypothetical protein
MRIFLIVTLFLVSCSKQPTGETEGISYQTATTSIFYAKGNLTAQRFCTKMLYTISSQVDSTEELMISVVTDSLKTGSYQAGLSHWGSPSLADNITLNVVSYNNGVLNATYAGTLSSGRIRNVHN